MKKEHIVYKYVEIENGTILYIGKTDASLKQRVEAHEKEDKFLPYRGTWKIEYTVLENNVETDIVEKFLINQYKPVLNEKDKEEGLLGLTIGNMKWRPYEEYLEQTSAKNHQLLDTLTKEALLNDELFEAAYDTYVENRDCFYTPFLHPTGLLPTPDGVKKITKPDVYRSINGYKQLLADDFIPYFSYPAQIRVLIWKEASHYYDFDNIQKKELEELNLLEEFSIILYEFAQNGFYDKLERCELTIPSHFKEINIEEIYAPLFLRYYSFEKEHIAEINCEAYSYIPDILERIAKKKLLIYKASGLIPYKISSSAS